MVEVCIGRVKMSRVGRVRRVVKDTPKCKVVASNKGRLRLKWSLSFRASMYLGTQVGMCHAEGTLD